MNRRHTRRSFIHPGLIMKKVAAVVLASCVPAGLAFAVVSVQVDSCSGARTTLQADALRLECTGNFSLYGGEITSDVKLVLVGTQSITLDHLVITAPEIEIVSDGSVNLGANVRLNVVGTISVMPVGTANVGHAGGSISPVVSVAPGATISIGDATAQPIDRTRVRVYGPIALVPQPQLAGGEITLQDNTAAVQSEDSGGGAMGGLWLLALAGVAALSGRRQRADA